MTTTGQGRNFYPALRVFVFGTEVTEDVLSVTVTHNDARAPSTAQIVLANKGTDNLGNGVEDRYIITELDIHALNDKVDFTKVLLPDVQAVLSNALLSQEADVFGVPLPTLGNVARGYEALITETTAQDIGRQIKDRVLRKVVDPFKAQVLATKVAERVQLPPLDARFGGPELAATADQIRALNGTTSRYPFQVGDCVFHSNDPVRIFFRDPQARAVEDAGQPTWYHMFAGYISDWVDDVNENNEKTVTLRCEDVLRHLRYARFTTSPGFTDIDAAATNVDLVLQTFHDDDFSELTLPEFLFSMVFGFTTARTSDLIKKLSADPTSLYGTTTVRIVSPNGPPTQADLPKDGVGFFSLARSAVFVLGPQGQAGPEPPLSTVSTLQNLEIRVQDLSVYQAYIDHQVRSSDLSSMALTTVTPINPNTLRTDARSGDVFVDDVIEAIGLHPEIYPVDGGRLVMLSPSTLGAGYGVNVLWTDVKGPELKTKWKNRLGKMYDILERLQFSMWATPKGDIVVEMPLHDFDPVDLGTTAVTFTDIKNVVGEARAKTILNQSDVVGPFADFYHVAKRDTIRWQRTFNDEKVKNLVTASWNNIPGLKVGGQGSSVGARPARRLLDALIPLFGVREEEAESIILVNNEKAAEIYCQLLLNRFNGDARTVACEVIPQLRFLPNRPVLFTERSFVGTIREVTHQLTWGEKGEMSMHLRLNYLRGWDGQFDEVTGRPFYTYLGGYRANPMNYALLVKAQNPPASQAELNVSTETQAAKPPDLSQNTRLGSIGNGFFLEEHAAAWFNAMKKAAAAAGFDLKVTSAERSFADQTALYAKYKGVNVAAPGTSRHESGSAVDIAVGVTRDPQTQLFSTANSPVYQWLQANAPAFNYANTVPSDPVHWEYIGGTDAGFPEGGQSI